MPTFVYDLPYGVRSDLVASLDEGDSWRELAGQRLGYSNLELHRFSDSRYKAGSSPSEALLTHWGQRNGTVEELFKHLHALALYRCMDVIKSCVPPSMHIYLQQRESPRQDNLGHVGRQRGPPPPLPAERSYQNRKVHLKDNLDLGGDCGRKIADKDLELVDSDFFGATTEEVLGPEGHNQTALKAIAVVTPDPITNLVPPLPSGQGDPSPNTQLLQSSSALRGRSENNSSLSRLRKRSGVPLPGDDDFLINNFPFHVLQQACSNFDREAPGVLLGHGGFGEVFRGKLNGQDVAIKRILEEKRFNLGSDAYQRCINQAITELLTLHRFPAENVLPLLAISFDPSFQTDPCLVYQLMPNGSVADRLRRRQGTAPLTWQQRANIALGTARGLRHLHANNVIHGDIKSGNILLDKHFEPKIGDFGLARGGPENRDASFKMVSIVNGTQAYLPEDYIRSHQLTVAVDTFCYGIFMFELVSARSPSFSIPDCPDHLRLRDFMLLSSTPDPWVDDGVPPSFWSRLLFYVGKDCTQRSRRQRPPMKQVLEALDRQFQQRSPALALQVYYDEQNRHNRGDTEESEDVPAILEEASKTHSATTSGQSSDTTTCSIIDSDMSESSVMGSVTHDVSVCDPSLPNLSSFLSFHRDRSAQGCDAGTLISDEDLPDLSLLQVTRTDETDARLQQVEAAVKQAADIKDALR